MWFSSLYQSSSTMAIIDNSTLFIMSFFACSYFNMLFSLFKNFNLDFQKKLPAACQIHYGGSVCSLLSLRFFENCSLWLFNFALLKESVVDLLFVGHVCRCMFEKGKKQDTRLTPVCIHGTYSMRDMDM